MGRVISGIECMQTYRQEIKKGERFEFGANWTRFLSVLNDERIAIAEQSLLKMLEVENLEGRTFLDVGSGSGLFSLAARRLGAIVYSFDYDQQSVACTAELKRRYFPEDAFWKIETGSILDRQYLGQLEQFDVVYSWGVLHHTGAMWDALDNIISLVKPTGKLFISIYNDQPSHSERWKNLKRIYNQLPNFLRIPYIFIVMGSRELKSLFFCLLKGRLGYYVKNIMKYEETSLRGMSYWHDIVDWIGGYPFEVAKPEQIFKFYQTQGFELRQLKTCAGGLGCNEFVFIRR